MTEVGQLVRAFVSQPKQRLYGRCQWCGVHCYSLDGRSCHACSDLNQLYEEVTENNRPGPHELDAQNAGRG